MAITFIGSAFGVDTATLPAHRAGDLILVFAYNDAATTIPTIGAGFSTINAPTGGNSNSHRLAYRLATSSAETLGTWTGATQLVVQVYRGVDPANPIGTSANLTNVADVTYPALTLAVQNGTSWVAAIHGRRTGNVENAAVPPGTVLRSDTGTSGAGRILGHDTNAGVSSWPQLATGGNNTFRYRSVSVEMRAAAVQGTSGQAAATLGALSLASAGRISLRAALARALAPLSTVSAGKLPVRGQGGGRLANGSLTSAGRLLSRGAASVVLDGLGIVARSASQGRAQVASVLADLTAGASGRSARRGAASVRLGDLTTVSSGKTQNQISGRVSGQLASATIVASGQVRARGALGVVLDAVGLAAAGSVRIAGVMAARLGDLVLRAASGRPVRTPVERTVRPALERRLVVPVSESRVVRVPLKGDNMLRWPSKDPDDVLDYAIDWSAKLDGDTIASVEWIVPDGLTMDRSSSSGTITTIWLSGGFLGTYPKVTCRVITTGARQFDQTVTLKIEQR